MRFLKKDYGINPSILYPVNDKAIIRDNIIKLFLTNYRILGNGTLLLIKSSREDGGQYLCKVDNGVGGGISKLAQVTINGKPKQINNLITIACIRHLG